MSVGTICTRPIRAIPASATVRQVSFEMLEHHVGTFIVTEDDKPIGMVTDRDIVIRCLARDNDPDEMLVSEIMSEPIEAVYEDASPTTALEMMADREVRRLVVKDALDVPVGVVALDDILDYFVAESGELGRLLRRRQPV